MSGPPLVILGAGAFAREVHAVLIHAGLDARLRAFVEDDAPEGKRVHSVPVLETAAALAMDPSSVRLCAAIGSPARRALIERFLARGFQFETIVHPGAWVGPGVKVGAGTVVCAGAVLDTDLTLGDHVVVHAGCFVGHDCTVGAYSTLSPHACLNGYVTLDAGAFIGTGATLLSHVHVGEGAVIGAGATVTRRVAPGVTVAGVPARPLARKSG
jgi:sugar O-acyltransferase (sialic acid O-acetyltransferase NeuD family)